MSISRCHSDLELKYFVALCPKCIALPPCLLNTLLKKMSTFDRFPLKSFWIEMDDKRPDVNPNITNAGLARPEIQKSGRNPARTNLEEILLEQMHLVGNNWQWSAAEELKLARKFILKIPGPIVSMYNNDRVDFISPGLKVCEGWWRWHLAWFEINAPCLAPPDKH